MNVPSRAEIRARYEVLTPCFCSGAEKDQAEVRLPSVKGVLRFWWRALAWSAYRGDLACIQEEEAKLFGDAGTGQSRLLLRFASPPNPDVWKAGTVLPGHHPSATAGPGARYLAYGAVVPFGTKANQKKHGELERACLAPPFDVDLRLRCRRELRDEQADLLRRALIALGLFGGLGSRSRNGYGSLTLRELSGDGIDDWLPPADLGGLSRSVAEILPGYQSPAPPPYSALDAGTRVVLVHGQGHPMKLLDQLGDSFKGWLGRDGSPRERDQKALHRSAFGLPRHFGNGQLTPHREPRPVTRRASPLLVHIHGLADNRPVAVLTFLPTQFLPHDARRIAIKRGTTVAVPPEPELYRSVHNFLDQLLADHQAREVRPR